MLSALLGRKRLLEEQVVETEDPRFSVLESQLAQARSPLQTHSQTAVFKLVSETLDSCVEFPQLALAKHTEFARQVRSPLSENMTQLDSSMAWVLYWTANIAKLVGASGASGIKGAKSAGFGKRDTQRMAERLLSFQHQDGGFCGGPNDTVAHLASSYAALVALSYCRSENWHKINRDKFYDWLVSLKQPNGSFAMHTNGEADVRAVYCALSCATILNIVTPELLHKTFEFLTSCQTYEGGFCGSPGNEAHGGYTYCAVASLCMFGHPRDMLANYCNLPNLVRWCTERQMAAEGGFQGRCNKDVDSCYSHWLAGVFPFLQIAANCTSLYSRYALSNYLYLCCQDSSSGGFRDKPGKSCDFYHTNYALLGLSYSQHEYTFNTNKFAQIGSAAFCYNAKRICDTQDYEDVPHDRLRPANPVFGCLQEIENMYVFFSET